MKYSSIINADTYTCFDVFECTFITSDFHQFHCSTFIGHETNEFTDDITNDFSSFAFALEEEMMVDEFFQRMIWYFSATCWSNAFRNEFFQFTTFVKTSGDLMFRNVCFLSGFRCFTRHDSI